jgi:hypothetical protein
MSQGWRWGGGTADVAADFDNPITARGDPAFHFDYLIDAPPQTTLSVQSRQRAETRLQIVRFTISFALSLFLGLCFVWLAFQRPDAVPYVAALIIVALLGQFWRETRSERKRTALGTRAAAGATDEESQPSSRTHAA